MVVVVGWGGGAPAAQCSRPTMPPRRTARSAEVKGRRSMVTGLAQVPAAAAAGGGDGTTTAGGEGCGCAGPVGPGLVGPVGAAMPGVPVDSVRLRRREMGVAAVYGDTAKK